MIERLKNAMNEMNVERRGDALAGKAVVITGAGQGLGAAYARLAAREGARVVVNDINAAAAQSVVSEIVKEGGAACASAADISSWEGAGSLIAQCIARYGVIDGLVNNAARFYMARPEEDDEARLRALIEVNVLGTAFCGLEALRHMMPRGRGSIVNITSGAQAGIGAQAAYGASKGAVAALTYSWAIDGAPKGVRVNAVSPMARTAMADAANAYFSERGDKPWAEIETRPEENAPAVVYLLSDAAAAINGQVLRIDGRRLALMTHPAVLHPPLERDQWSVQSVQEAFEQGLAASQVPLGVTGAETIFRPYELVYPSGAVPRSA